MAMKDIHRKALDRTLEQLIRDLDVEPAIVHLKSKDVFNDRNEDCITVKATRLDKVREFVSCLKRSGDNAFFVFQRYLAEQPSTKHLADLLLQNVKSSEEKVEEKMSGKELQPTCSSAVDKCEIFISYCLTKSKEKVKELKRKIDERLKTECWICENQLLFGDNLDSKITQAITDAKVVLCMIDQPFVDSEECKKEVDLAEDLGIPMIYVYLQSLDKKPLKKSDGKVSGLNLPNARNLWCNQYTEDEERKNQEFEILIQSISRFVQKRSTAEN